MPLEKGNTRAAISHNIETEKAAGKSQSQSVAIALHTAKDDAVFLSAPAAQSTFSRGYEEQSTMGVDSNQGRVNMEPITSDSDMTSTTAMTVAEINAKNATYWGRGGKSPEAKDGAFTKLESKLEHKGESKHEAGAVAATAGREKYGKEGMAAKAAAGRK